MAKVMASSALQTENASVVMRLPIGHGLVCYCRKKWVSSSSLAKNSCACNRAD